MYRASFLTPVLVLAAGLLVSACGGSGAKATDAGGGERDAGMPGRDAASEARASDAKTRDARAADTGAADGSSPDATGDAPAGDASADAPPPSNGMTLTVASDAGALAARPFSLHVPQHYDPSKPTPLVVMFHGYSASGAEQELYFQITATSDAHDFLYAYGDGLVDQMGYRYWNATNACCDFYDVPVDDVAYFDAIVANVRTTYNVDPKRIFAIGHSNGGFMSHRLACDRASTVAAIVSLAGAQWDDPSKCNPTEPVSIAEVHGDSDTTIFYDGGSTPEGTYPSAHTTVATWAAKNGCTGALAPTGKTLTLDTTLPPNQTAVSAYGSCPAGIDVQLWTIHGANHIPALPYPGWGDDVWGFLSAHPKK